MLYVMGTEVSLNLSNKKEKQRLFRIQSALPLVNNKLKHQCWSCPYFHAQRIIQTSRLIGFG